MKSFAGKLEGKLYEHVYCLLGQTYNLSVASEFKSFKCPRLTIIVSITLLL